MRPRVKICGVTSETDVDAVLAAGADFVGLNFYPPSPRYVEPGRAAGLRRHIGDRAVTVGVFADCVPAEVARIDRTVGLDLLQFHGGESREEVVAFGDRAIKVFRVADPGREGLLDGYESVWGFLFDSPAGAGYGGTGSAWSWEAVARVATSRPVFVAGGIRPDNVGELVSRFSPWGIDLSSGVESAPGTKDPQLLQRLFEEIDHVEVASRS